MLKNFRKKNDTINVPKNRGFRGTSLFLFFIPFQPYPQSQVHEYMITQYKHSIIH